MQVTNFLQIACKIFSFIRASNSNIGIHCKAGFGRTGTIIGIWQALYYGISPRDAICWMRVCRPGMVNGVQAKYQLGLKFLKKENYNNTDTGSRRQTNTLKNMNKYLQSVPKKSVYPERSNSVVAVNGSRNVSVNGSTNSIGSPTKQRETLRNNQKGLYESNLHNPRQLQTSVDSNLQKQNSRQLQTSVESNLLKQLPRKLERSVESNLQNRDPTILDRSIKNNLRKPNPKQFETSVDLMSQKANQNHLNKYTNLNSKQNASIERSKKTIEQSKLSIEESKKSIEQSLYFSNANFQNSRNLDFRHRENLSRDSTKHFRTNLSKPTQLQSNSNVLYSSNIDHSNERISIVYGLKGNDENPPVPNNKKSEYLSIIPQSSISFRKGISHIENSQSNYISNKSSAKQLNRPPIFSTSAQATPVKVSVGGKTKHNPLLNFLSFDIKDSSVDSKKLNFNDRKISNSYQKNTKNEIGDFTTPVKIDNQNIKLDSSSVDKSISINKFNIYSKTDNRYSHLNKKDYESNPYYLTQHNNNFPNRVNSQSILNRDNLLRNNLDNIKDKFRSNNRKIFDNK